MNKKTRIILPIALAAVGVFSIFFGRQGQVSADVYSTTGSTSLYVLLTAAGFLLISVAAIIVLFVIASGEKK